MELSTYFRINAEKTGRLSAPFWWPTKTATLATLKAVPAPVRDGYQLHAAVVEVIIHKNAEVKYSTVQNWFPGDNNTGGILNFVTKRALCEGETAKCHGRNQKPGQRLRGNIPAAFCAAITPLVSFTQWR